MCVCAPLAAWRSLNMQPIHALSTEHVVGEVLVYNFQILSKQTSIIAVAVYKLWELKPRTHSLVANLGVGSHMCPLRGGFGHVTT